MAANIQTKNYTTKRFHLFYIKEWRALFRRQSLAYPQKYSVIRMRLVT